MRFSLPEDEPVLGSFQQWTQQWEWGQPVRMKHLRELHAAGELADGIKGNERPQAVLLERFFHCPTGLSDDQSVELAFESTPGVQAWVNDRPLALQPDSPTDAESKPTECNLSFRIEIKHLLQKRNQLQVVFSSAYFLIQNVMLEIAD